MKNGGERCAHYKSELRERYIYRITWGDLSIFKLIFSYDSYVFIGYNME